MATLIELLIIFATSFGVQPNPIRWTLKPAHRLHRSHRTRKPDPATMVLVGVIIAFAAALAKGIHYMVTFFVSGHLSQKRQERLHADARQNSAMGVSAAVFSCCLTDS